MNLRLLLTLFCLGCVPESPDYAPAPPTPSEPKYAFTVERVQPIKPIASVEPLPPANDRTTPRRWVALFMSDRCPPCKRIERDILPALRKRGLSVSETRGGDVYVIDVDKRPDLARKHSVDVVPCWLFCDLEVETARELGVMTADEITSRLRGE